MKRNIEIALIAAIALIGVSFVQTQVIAQEAGESGWQGPTAAPPAGNVPAPLNTGSSAQSKTGNLTLSGQTTLDGLVEVIDTRINRDSNASIFSRIFNYTDPVLRVSGTQTVEGVTAFMPYNVDVAPSAGGAFFGVPAIFQSKVQISTGAEEGKILVSKDTFGEAEWRSPEELNLGSGGGSSVIESGVINHGETIPLPVGVTDQSQCHWMVSLNNSQIRSDRNYGEMTVSVDANRVVTAVVYDRQKGGNHEGTANYIIICGDVSLQSGGGTDNDTLADLSCQDGDTIKWNATNSVWECQATSSFGPMQDITTSNNEAQGTAQTDGFLVVIGAPISGGGFTVYIDEGSGFELVAEGDTTSRGSRIAGDDTLTVPVRKGSSWQIRNAANGYVHWLPFGN